MVKASSAIGCCAALLFPFFSSGKSAHSQDRGAIFEMFQRGDANLDGKVGLSDVVYELQLLFPTEYRARTFGCQDAADANDNGQIEISDCILILFYLFEDPFLLPGPFCVADPTEDRLDCKSYPGCGTPPVKAGPLGMDLIFIPPGSFFMGSPPGEKDRETGVREDKNYGEDLHQVTLTYGLYIGKTEVTQQQYRELMGDLPSPSQWYIEDAHGGVGQRGDDLPVVFVNWDEAAEFCRVLSKLEGTAFRLPTEAEWEYACRAGTQTRFSFGDALACPNEMACCFECYDLIRADPFAPCCTICIPGCNAGEYMTMTGFPIWGRDGIGIVPVGLYKPNPWGLFDMHGNASEWVQDYAGRYPRGPVTDPVGPSWAEYRIVRGHAPGSSALAFGRSAARMPFDREEKYYWSGFRVVQKVPVVLPGHYFPD